MNKTLNQVAYLGNFECLIKFNRQNENIEKLLILLHNMHSNFSCIALYPNNFDKREEVSDSNLVIEYICEESAFDIEYIFKDYNVFLSVYDNFFVLYFFTNAGKDCNLLKDISKIFDIDKFQCVVGFELDYDPYDLLKVTEDKSCYPLCVLKRDMTSIEALKYSNSVKNDLSDNILSEVSAYIMSRVNKS